MSDDTAAEFIVRMSSGTHSTSHGVLARNVALNDRTEWWYPYIGAPGDDRGTAAAAAYTSLLACLCALTEGRLDMPALRDSVCARLDEAAASASGGFLEEQGFAFTLDAVCAVARGSAWPAHTPPGAHAHALWWLSMFAVSLFESEQRITMVVLSGEAGRDDWRMHVARTPIRALGRIAYISYDATRTRPWGVLTATPGTKRTSCVFTWPDGPAYLILAVGAAVAYDSSQQT